jgi:hypothetical protein
VKRTYQIQVGLFSDFHWGTQYIRFEVNNPQRIEIELTDSEKQTKNQEKLGGATKESRQILEEI